MNPDGDGHAQNNVHLAPMMPPPQRCVISSAAAAAAPEPCAQEPSRRACMQ
eukprot:m.111239 g.111239  ORF g.111239 m.111239 type:complete len:51 (+) comp9082_c0_seq4:1695-1847(+)